MRKWRPNQSWKMNKTEVQSIVHNEKAEVLPIPKNEEAEIQPILENEEMEAQPILENEQNGGPVNRSQRKS
jgi:hypothetical protein